MFGTMFQGQGGGGGGGAGAGIECVMSRHAGQVIPANSGSGAKILLDTVEIDNNSMADLANSQIVIKTAGLYHIIGEIYWSTAASALYRMLVLVNGNPLASGDDGSNGNYPNPKKEFVVNLAVNDVVTLNAMQQSGSNQTTQSGIYGQVCQLDVYSIQGLPGAAGTPGAQGAPGTPGGTPLDGWVPDGNTWTFSALVDAPVFVVSVNADMTGILQPGDRVKFTQTTVKYFIVLAVGSFSGGATLITIYGGTDFALVNAAISAPYYSHAKAPFGFNCAEDKWQTIFTDATDQVIGGAANGVWYNILSYAFPLGVWDLDFQCWLGAAGSNPTNGWVTLSTGPTTQSDRDLTAVVSLSGISAQLDMKRMKRLRLAAKTTYYVNLETTVNGNSSLILYNLSLYPLVIRLKCAYL